jgi:hypothetical protein
MLGKIAIFLGKSFEKLFFQEIPRNFPRKVIFRGKKMYEKSVPGLCEYSFLARPNFINSFKCTELNKKRFRQKLGHSENIFFVGCGVGDDRDCIGNDFAVLAACNHTITTHGSFGTW